MGRQSERRAAQRAGSHLFLGNARRDIEALGDIRAERRPVLLDEGAQRPPDLRHRTAALRLRPGSQAARLAAGHVDLAHAAEARLQRGPRRLERLPGRGARSADQRRLTQRLSQTGMRWRCTLIMLPGCLAGTIVAREGRPQQPVAGVKVRSADHAPLQPH